MSGDGILISIVVGLVINEMCDVSPWCARRLVRLSVRLRYADLERRRIRAEELVALIDERPGKLLKLGTSLGFLGAALPSWIRRAAVNALRAGRARGRLSRGAPRVLSESTILTVRNLSSLPVVALEVGTAVSGLGVSRGVVSINGIWGSGKTTIARAAMEALRETQGLEAQAITYNPWIWSNHDGRVHALGGLPAAIRASNPVLDPMATALERYLSGLLRGNSPRLQSLRQRRARHRLAVALRTVPNPVVIALDDIDRMRREHVRQVFDAVAQTSGLPKFGYLLSFDRLVVEPQLSPGVLDGCVGEFRVELACGTCRVWAVYSSAADRASCQVACAAASRADGVVAVRRSRAPCEVRR